MSHNTTDNIMEAGMNCLVRALGMVDAERFIFNVKQNDFDHTKWQQEYFDKKSPAEIDAEAIAYNQAHPYRGTAKII